MTHAPDQDPTDSEAAPAGKLRRLGLYVPWAVAAAMVVAWSLAWLWLMHETERRIDATAAALRAAGWQASWSARHVGGYPFRLDVDLTGLALAEPSGWALAVPSLKSEAYAFAPTQWILAAPEGLTFTRPDGGPIKVDARSLRASISGWNERPPRIAVEGVGLAFTAAPGAKPFSLVAAKTLQFDTRAAPNNDGLVYLRLDGGATRPGGWLGRFAAGEPISLSVEGVVAHAGALQGPGWRSAVSAWSHGGGSASIHDVILSTPSAGFESKSGDVSVGEDGRLVGALQASLRQPERLLGAFGAKAAKRVSGRPTPNPPADRTVRFTFRNGSAWADAARLGPAPRVF